MLVSSPDTVPAQCSSILGAVQATKPRRRGANAVHSEGNQVGQATWSDHHGNGQSMTTPSTMLITELDSGALVLQGRPDGPRAYLSPADAAPLKRELAAAFERTELNTVGDNQG